MRLTLQNFSLSLVVFIVFNQKCSGFRIDGQESINIDDNDRFSADYDGDYNDDFIADLKHSLGSSLHDDYEVRICDNFLFIIYVV